MIAKNPMAKIFAFILLVMGTPVLSHDHSVLDEIVEVYGKECTISTFRRFAKGDIGENEIIDMWEREIRPMDNKEFLAWLREKKFHNRADAIISITAIIDSSPTSERDTLVKWITDSCRAGKPVEFPEMK